MRLKPSNANCSLNSHPVFLLSFGGGLWVHLSHDTYGCRVGVEKCAEWFLIHYLVLEQWLFIIMSPYLRFVLPRVYFQWEKHILFAFMFLLQWRSSWHNCWTERIAIDLACWGTRQWDTLWSQKKNWLPFLTVRIK